MRGRGDSSQTFVFFLCWWTEKVCQHPASPVYFSHNPGHRRRESFLKMLAEELVREHFLVHARLYHIDAFWGYCSMFFSWCSSYGWKSLIMLWRLLNTLIFIWHNLHNWSIIIVIAILPWLVTLLIFLCYDIQYQLSWLNFTWIWGGWPKNMFEWVT